MIKSDEVLTLEHVGSWLPPRQKESHKGCFGHVVVVGGDVGMPGAVRLAAEGALRVGAGRVTVVTRGAHVTSTVCGRPELLCYGVEHRLTTLRRLLQSATVVVLGPGLGQSRWSKRLFQCVVAANIPLLVDADGLTWLCRQQLAARTNWILTPHPGEAARLLNTTAADIQVDRREALCRLQQRYGGVVVLKGAETLLKEQRSITRCLAGNPGMASSGMGDLLGGMIAGFVAQGLTLWQAAQTGVLLHALAGDRVALQQGERGMLASDVLAMLPQMMI